MNTLEILKAARGQRMTRSLLRSAVSTLGLELARGTVRDPKSILDELAWLEVDEPDSAYALALHDLITALVAEGAALAHEVAAAVAVVKPGWWQVLELLQRHGIPRTATELAPELGKPVSTTHRWLGHLDQLELVVSVPTDSGRERPFALTRQALVALDARATTTEPNDAARERDELTWVAKRPVAQLDMLPLDRTLYWALLHWADELLSDDGWSVDDVDDARDLRRFLVALGQATASATPFTDERSGETRALLRTLWSYRTLQGQRDDDLDAERRFLAAKPTSDDHPGRLAWAIAAIRVAHSARLVAARVDDDARLRDDATALEATLRADAAGLLEPMTVPLAVFWSELTTPPQRHGPNIDARLAAADLGVTELSPVRRNLALCREHLRVAARSNVAGEAVQAGLRAMQARVERTFDHVRWDRTDDAMTWIGANRGPVDDAMRAYLIDDPDLVDAARHWCATVDLDSAALSVETIARDRNLFHHQEVCRRLLALAGTAMTGAQLVRPPPGLPGAGLLGSPKDDQLHRIEDSAPALVSWALCTADTPSRD